MTTPILSELLQQATALRALARELVGEASADDIVQETAIQALTAPPRRDGPTGGWLVAVVRRLASKDRRAQRVRHRHEARAARPDCGAPDRSAEDADVLRRLTELVTSLPEPYRGTILARYLREQMPGEIAAATHTPVRTVKTRLQRGLAMLREELAARDEDWRPALLGAFALHPPSTITPTATAVAHPLSTTMKIALFAAVLLPIAAVAWRLGPGADPARSAPDLAPDGAVALAGTLADENAKGAADPSAPRAERGTNQGARGDALPDGTAAPLSDASGPALAPVPFMRLDVVGPAAFRAAFAPTNLGALAASKEGEALWRPLLAPAERIWQQWNGDREFEATRQRVLDYTGRIRVLWMVQPDAELGTDRVFGVLALETDGATDLSALAGDLSRTIQAILPDEPTPRSVGEHALQLVGDPEGESMTLPVVLGGSLVAFFGEAAELERTVPQCLQALAADTAPPPAPVSFQLDLAQLRALWALRESPAVADFLGMRSLRSLRASLGPNGRLVQLQVDVEFEHTVDGAPQRVVDDSHRGVLAGLLPSVGSLPGLLARVPPAATPWLALPLRADLMLRAGLEVAAAQDESEGGVEGVRQSMHEELGFYPDTELLDHLGGEVMILGDLWQPEDPDVFRRGDNPPLGACVAFSLRDAAAFRSGLDKLVHYLKGHVHLYETREVDGVQVTRLGTMFLTGMHMAVGQGLFAIGFGDEGVAQLEALVASRPAAAAGTYPAPVQRVSDLAPAGWNGVGAANLSALLDGQIVLVLEMLDDALPAAMRFGFSSDTTQDWLDKLRPLVEKHEVDHIVAMTGFDRGHWRLRMLW